MKLEWVDETKFFSEEEQSEPEQRVAGAMVRLLVTAGNFDFKSLPERELQKIHRYKCRLGLRPNAGHCCSQSRATGTRAAHHTLGQNGWTGATPVVQQNISSSFEIVSLTKNPLGRVVLLSIRQCEPLGWLLASSSCMETAPLKS